MKLLHVQTVKTVVLKRRKRRRLYSLDGFKIVYLKHLQEVI